MLSEMGFEDAKAKIENLGQLAKSLKIPLGGRGLGFTISAGVISGQPIKRQEIKIERSEYVLAAQRLIEAAKANLEKTGEGQYLATDKV